jgi:hypothetical protein
MEHVTGTGIRSAHGQDYPRIRAGGLNPAGYQFLQQQILNSINSQLVIQNSQR